MSRSEGDRGTTGGRGGPSPAELSRQEEQKEFQTEIRQQPTRQEQMLQLLFQHLGVPLSNGGDQESVLDESGETVAERGRDVLGRKICRAGAGVAVENGKERVRGRPLKRERVEVRVLEDPAPLPIPSSKKLVEAARRHQRAGIHQC